MATPRQEQRQSETQNEGSPRSRDEVLQQIKLALLTKAGLGVEMRARGFDPYNSKLGSATRDVWGGKRSK